MRRNFVLIFLCLISSQSYAASSERECIERYVGKAQSNFAARVANRACSDLVNPPDYADFRARFFQYKYSEFKVDEYTGNLSGLHGSIWLVISDREVEELEYQYNSYKKNKRNIAKCILGKKDLYKASNDTAAKILYQNTGCVE